MVGSNLISGVVQAFSGKHFPALAYLLVDLVVLGAFFRTWTFRHQSWLAVIIAAQLGVVVLDLVWLSPFHPARSVIYDHLAYTISYVQLACLLCGVLRDWAGPPRRGPT